MYHDLVDVVIDLGILVAFLLLAVPWAIAVARAYIEEYTARREMIRRAAERRRTRHGRDHS